MCDHGNKKCNLSIKQIHESSLLAKNENAWVVGPKKEETRAILIISVHRSIRILMVSLLCVCILHFFCFIYLPQREQTNKHRQNLYNFTYQTVLLVNELVTVIRPNTFSSNQWRVTWLIFDGMSIRYDIKNILFDERR